MADKIGHPLILFLLIILCATTAAQDYSDQKDRQIEQIIESMEETIEGENDNSQVLEDFENFSENSLNINTAKAEEFEQLHLLDLSQIKDVLEYRNKFGSILSIYELYAIKSLTPGLINSLEPFVSFSYPDTIPGKKRTLQKLLLKAKASLPVSKGYASSSEKKPAAYPGLPLSLYSRYHFKIQGKLEFGFITDKDAGEEFFSGSNRAGFDYYSGFFSWKSESFLQQITIGDFYLKFGQGLNYWNGSGIGKSSNVINISKMGQGIRPYTSSDENRYFRGIASAVGKGSLKLMLFYSYKNRDANLSGDTVFTSLKTGGYHRTIAEIEDKKAISEQVVGGYAEWKTDNFRIGSLWSYHRFNLKMIKGTAPYKNKSFSGKENMNMGIDYQLFLNKLQFFGEAALSKNQKPAFLQGMIWHAHPQLNMSFYYRYFDPAFHSFYGNALSEGTEVRNERGFYAGIELYPIRNIKFSGYADLYYFPWLTYSTMAPSSGRDILGQIDFSFFKNFFFYLRGKLETKPQKYTKGNVDPLDYNESVNKFRFNSVWKITDKFSLKNRIEYVDYSFYKISEKGYLAYQDFDFGLFRKLNLWIRYAYFHTDGYNSRIYTYENDLLYSFSFPEFHGKGHRVYLNLKWQPAKHLIIYFKAGQTVHSEADWWGSGNDLTMGNYRSEIKSEFYFTF